jgi:hypothetical protein
VIEASGAPEAVGQALDLVRDGGRVIVVGQYTDHGDVGINPHRQINRKHVTDPRLLGIRLFPLPPSGGTGGAVRGPDALEGHGESPLFARPGGERRWPRSKGREVVKAVIVPGSPENH